MGNSQSSQAGDDPPRGHKSSSAYAHPHPQRGTARRGSAAGGASGAGGGGSTAGTSAKASAALPAATLDHATARPAQPDPPPQSRGRPYAASADSAKLPPPAVLNSRPGGDEARGSSPKPPLNVDTTMSPTEELQRTSSSTPSSGPDQQSPFYAPFSQFGRPPRLPLPIEEETLAPGSPAPGSPVLQPLDDDQAPKLDEAALRQSASVLSANTLDEEEDQEDEIYRADQVTGTLVDTLVEWKEGGEVVYLTGTFCAWQKKSRLHKNKNPNTFSAIIPLPTGTWYLSFLVDGLAKTASHMPTTVDYTNALVNYLHVSAEDVPAVAAEQKAGGPAVAIRVKSRPRDGAPATDVRAVSGAEPATHSPKPSRSLSRKQPGAASVDSTGKPRRLDDKRKRQDTRAYHAEIPPFLLDWDAPERSSRVRRANAVAETHTPPPQLPPYLQKSILSTATPMKDDSSVLVLPNHTVLNHLATSSIKDGVLGTSATTRYKRKFVTTLLYMPTTTGQAAG